MTDRSAEWAARRRAWEAERLAAALERAPERRERFSTIGDTTDRAALRPVVVTRRRSAARHRASRRAAVHPRHPPDRLPEPALDDADVRRVRCRRGHERAVPPAARGRPDRPVDRLRHADAVWLRQRRPRGRGRVRDVRRRRLEPGRHGDPARRAAARRRLDVDDHQFAGRADLGDVHRGRGEGRRPARPARGHDSRTTSSRSSSPRRNSSSRRCRRCGW